MGNCLKSRKKNPDTKNSQKEVEKNESVVHNKEKTTKPKSWETRPKLNKEDYQFVKKENEILFKKPG